MFDRQKLEALLAKRFPGAKPDQIASAANAIMGLDDEWEELANTFDAPRTLDAVSEFRVLRRRAV